MGMFNTGLAFVASLALGACGGIAADSGSASKPQQGSGAGASSVPDDAGQATADAGSLPTTDGPPVLVMTCPSALASVSLKLPCQVGQSIGGSLNVVECDLAGMQDSMARLPPISLSLSMAQLERTLGTPFQIPFDNLPPAPSGGYGTIAEYAGERFSGTFTGTVVFSRADVESRSFTARLTHAQFVWTGSEDSFTCTVSDGPFWAVAGDFL